MTPPKEAAPPESPEASRQTNDESSDCAERLRVLADRTRLEVVRLLFTGAKHVGELNESLAIDQSLLSHHLRVLREAGLVIGERDGKAVLYRLAPGVRVKAGQEAIHLGCCSLSFDS
ncbi:MAG: metalloregulator ArsR/SmtB family transcription factor [Deltaproteobacteria bacterium]|nr:metalloregulator ArsR/SmtB family transcription factor [Deltaproteobacteria bacterium]